MTPPTESKPTDSAYFPGKHPSLASDLDRFLAERRSQLEREGPAMGVAALVLAGGYGRGEGGVFIDENSAPRLYNDLEFYLFTRGPVSPALQQWIHQAEKAGRSTFGIDVEIHAMSAASLESAPMSMFYHDLVTRHIIVHGPPDFLTREPMERFRNSEAIPLHEATRLLFNRGSGLLFCAAKLQGIDPDFEQGFIQRNHAKAKLALGDAVLVLNGLYRTSCRERERLIMGRVADVPPCWNEIRRLHSSGVIFKFNPRHEKIVREELERQQRDLTLLWSEVFLWIENRRLGRAFKDLAGYARCRARILPEFPLWKNPAIRLRDTLRHGERLPRWFDYPRGVLQRALAAFLSRPDTKPDLAFGGRVLGVAQDSAFETFRRWWARYN